MSTAVSPHLTIDPGGSVPPYEQLRQQLDELISTGVLVDGQRLPSVRQLAADLTLAPGTVARAYSELEEGGLVQSRRGAGTRVTAPTTLINEDARQGRLMELVDEVTRHASALGMSPESAAAMLEQAMRRRR